MSLGRIPGTTCDVTVNPSSALLSVLLSTFRFYFIFFLFLYVTLSFIYQVLLTFLPSYYLSRPSQAGQLFNEVSNYLLEQWESLDGIKFNHRAKINTKIFCLSGVLREESFYFGQGTLGSLKKMGPQRPLLRTHCGLQYYYKFLR